MKTLRKLIYREALYAISYVLLGFLALFFFFDVADELPSVGKGIDNSYGLSQALQYSALWLPSNLYVLMPIGVLIGSVFVLSRLASSSEFTILRTSGLGPGRALQHILGLGLMFSVVTFIVGDFIAPAADRQAQLLRARYFNAITLGQTGAWLREKTDYSQFSVNIGALKADTSLQGVRIFEMDNLGRMVSITQAASARITEGAWQLSEVSRTEFVDVAGQRSKAERSALAELRWPTEMTLDMVSTALLKPERMGTADLYRYIQHLERNAQTSQKYEIQFWRKVFYPLSCVVMVILALPFAYFHFRRGSVTGFVFLGVVIGISFVLLNNMFGYIGNLQNWTPWIAAGAPSLIYMLASLAAFTWLVLRR
jgi:lipopolysaccharide export system permease protein